MRELWRAVPGAFARAGLVLILTILLPGGAAAQDGEAGAETFAFEAQAINPGLPPADPPMQRDTPRAALDAFLDAIRSREYLRAAHALNLSAFPPEEQATRGPTLALMLAFVLRRYDLVDWQEIPDQPDARVLPGLEQTVGPYSRRSVPLGEVTVDGRPVPVSMQRFEAPDSDPVWLFSPFVVQRVPALYAESRPGLFSEWVPLERRLETLGRSSALEWLGAAIFLAAAVAIGLLVNLLTRLAARRLPARWTPAVRRAAIPLAIALAAGAFTVGTSYLFLLTGPVASSLGITAEIVALVAVAWLLLKVLSAVSLAASERYLAPLAADDPEHRRTRTTVYVMRRVSLVLVTLLSLAYILVRTGLFESFGVSVLASAGALGVLVAIGAQPLFGNMVAGMQIALTDPVRLGDVVVYDGQFATVEDISFAHLVLLTDRDTRLIVPHADFLSRPFENWSKKGEAVWCVVKIPVDYRADITRIRAFAEDLVTADPRSARRPVVEVGEADADAVTVWVSVCGTSASAAWTLHNHVREAVIGFLQKLDGGAYLPRRRYLLEDPLAGRSAETELAKS